MNLLRFDNTKTVVVVIVVVDRNEKDSIHPSAAVNCEAMHDAKEA